MNKIHLLFLPLITGVFIVGCGGSGGNVSSSSNNSSTPTGQSSSASSVGQTRLTLNENDPGYCSADGAIDTEWSGYSGPGYINSSNATGALIRWQVDAALQGSYTLRVRFANGSSAARIATLSINGSVNATLVMDAQTDWQTWQTIETEVDLAEGNNRIEFIAAGDQGLANIDWIQVDGEDIQPGNCGAITSSSSSSSASSPAAYQAVTSEYEFLNTNTSNALYKDSARFRVYYGGNNMTGGDGNIASASQRDLDLALAHLESAYDYFVTDWGFRSPSLSVHSDNGPYYKMNVYPTTTLNAGGAMGYDARAGLSFLEIHEGLLANQGVTVHEFGHSLTLTEYNWVDQGRTGAWWETVANWVTDTYQMSPAYERVRQQFSLPASNTIINLDTTIGRSYLTIVHSDNRYEAWPFLTYLTNNPDYYPGLGKMAIPDLIRNHPRNNETPLHVLNRIASPVSAQTILGRYWARMAYLDIGHPLAQQAFFNRRNNSTFRNSAFANLEAVGNQTYRVRGGKQPMYGGANISPLTVTGNQIGVQITNLGNGLSDSNFTATLAIRSNGGSIRYVVLENGAGQIPVASNEEVSLVMVNTPDTLYQYNAFESTASSPDVIGLNYEVQITGAMPAY